MPGVRGSVASCPRVWERRRDNVFGRAESPKGQNMRTRRRDEVREARTPPTPEEAIAIHGIGVPVAENTSLDVTVVIEYESGIFQKIRFLRRV